MPAGLVNFRDVGDGRTIRAGRLFRSDSLDRLTSAGTSRLQELLGIRTVLDLRAPGEAAGIGVTGDSRSADTAPVRITAPLTGVGLAPLERRPGDSPLVADYVARLTGDPVLPQAIEIVAASVHRPTVVHCTAGKDRTGIVIALVLALAEAPREYIVQDYLATARNLPALLERTTRELPDAWYECSPEPIEALLDTLDRNHGGARAWAHSAGIPLLTLAALRLALRPDLP